MYKGNEVGELRGTLPKLQRVIEPLLYTRFVELMTKQKHEIKQEIKLVLLKLYTLQLEEQVKGVQTQNLSNITSRAKHSVLIICQNLSGICSFRTKPSIP